MKKMGYLGPAGTYSEDAALRIAKKSKEKLELVSYPSIPELILAADGRKIDRALAPLENSIEGTIGIVQDLLVTDVSLKIMSEFVLSIRNALMAPAGVKIIAEIISHPQPLAQCEPFLRKNYPRAKLTSVGSTAQALNLARSLTTSDHGVAAIGPRDSAKQYGLKIWRDDISALPNNHTRFVVLGKKDSPKTRNDKTSIVFSIRKDKPGGLYGILGEFAQHAINLTKIESRPAKTTLGDYYFFIDFQGHREDEKVAEVLRAIRRKSSMLKILGSYPRSAG